LFVVATACNNVKMFWHINQIYIEYRHSIVLQPRTNLKNFKCSCIYIYSDSELYLGTEACLRK
jgi:hypothetical protein